MLSRSDTGSGSERRTPPRSPRKMWETIHASAAAKQFGAAAASRTPLLPDRTRRCRRTSLRLTCYSVIFVFVCLVVLVYLAPSAPHTHSADFRYVSEQTCASHSLQDSSTNGFSETPVESTVLMLYSPSAGDGQFCYSGATAAGGAVVREFLRVAASYVSSPHEGPAGPYYDFFAAHNATLWTVDSATRVAEPMRLDVVYTFVNPSAPSFRRHVEARRLPFEQRRYRDWEELRYSLRSLREFVLKNAALSQYHRRHAADVARLGELGYTVNVSAVSGVAPLVRRVYLVLADKDQVPEWLDTEKFPELRVVTHRDMFSAEEAAWVLPTLNSNVIESGLHRIPGISRFFFYTANDMLVGRRLSLFDLFRPLSPLRQRLHLYNISGGAVGGSDGAAWSNATGRVAMLLEPVLHSDTQSVKSSGSLTSSEREAASHARGEISACMAYRVDLTLRAHDEHVPRWSKDVTLYPSWETTEGFAMHDPHYGLTPRGAGVTPAYYYHLTSIRLHGIDPPFGYAHIPQLVDREVYRRMNEVELFHYTNTTRRAYEREMYPYSPVDMYAVFGVAMMRGAERHLWNTVWRNAPDGAFTDVRAKLTRWWEDRVENGREDVATRLSRQVLRATDISMFGALYGDTWQAHLQHPDLEVELSYWWVRGAVRSARPTRTLRALQKMYAIPKVAVGATCAKAKPVWAARSEDHYYSLLHDMFHHTKRDETFLFEMLESDMKAFLVAARLQFEWVHRPLFLGFNDNFPDDTNFTVSKYVFNTLLRIVSNECAPAPWERY